METVKYDQYFDNRQEYVEYTNMLDTMREATWKRTQYDRMTGASKIEVWVTL